MEEGMQGEKAPWETQMALRKLINGVKQER